MPYPVFGTWNVFWVVTKLAFDALSYHQAEVVTDDGDLEL